MCKSVCLIYNRFDFNSKEFCYSLGEELKKNRIDFDINNSNDIFNKFRKHKTYRIAIGVEFFSNGEIGRGLVINDKCSYISNEFAYTLSNNVDSINSKIRWRDFEFMESDAPKWFKFFNKVSAEVKLIFHPCVKNCYSSCEEYSVTFEKTIKIFTEEIVRCLRADCDFFEYKKRVKLSKVKLNKRNSK